MRFLRALFTLAIAFLPATLIGCREDEVIVKETVTFPDREMILKKIAVFPREDLVWFILISGPEEEVRKNLATFDAFVRSAKIDLKYDEKKHDPPVVWEEPKAWRKDHPTGSFLRYAGFRIDAKPKELEISVTRMAAEGFSLLSNVNRWQKQVNVPQAEREEELNPKYASIKREKINDQEVIWVEVKGLAIHTVSKPPEPMALKAKNVVPDLQLQKGAPAARSPFKYEAPAGWRKQDAPGQFAVDYYKAGDGNNVVDVKLTPLPGGGTVGGNVNRWRGEVKLPKVSEQDAANIAVRMKVAGADAYYVDIANPNGPATFNRTLAVTIPMGDTTWFIKMSGPLNAVEQHKTEFDAFVRSFKQ